MKIVNLKSALFATALLSFTAIAAINDKTDSYQVSRAAGNVPSGIELERTRVEFIWPQVQLSLGMPAANQIITSDHYWQMVSGKELKSGVKVAITASDALIRVAPRASYINGAMTKSSALRVEEVTLYDEQKKNVSAKQLASAEAMKLAGFDDGSVALKLQQRPIGETLVLRTSQAVSDSDQYLLHVKERTSPYKMQIEASTLLDKADNRFSLKMQLAGYKALLDDIAVELITPDKAIVPIKYANGYVMLPDNMESVGAYQGLYEIQVNTQYSIDGIVVKRSAKVPFAQRVNTASISGIAEQKGDRLYLPMTIEEPGRFAITATLQGFNRQGKQVSIQTGEVAQWMDESGVIELPFQLKQLSDFSGPFSLKNIKLMDQSRLMLLQQIPSLSPEANTW